MFRCDFGKTVAILIADGTITKCHLTTSCRESDVFSVIGYRFEAMITFFHVFVKIAEFVKLFLCVDNEKDGKKDTKKNKREEKRREEKEQNNIKDKTNRVCELFHHYCINLKQYEKKWLPFQMCSPLSVLCAIDVFFVSFQREKRFE